MPSLSARICRHGALSSPLACCASAEKLAKEAPQASRLPFFLKLNPQISIYYRLLKTWHTFSWKKFSYDLQERLRREREATNRKHSTTTTCSKRQTPKRMTLLVKPVIDVKLIGAQPMQPRNPKTRPPRPPNNKEMWRPDRVPTSLLHGTPNLHLSVNMMAHI